MRRAQRDYFDLWLLLRREDIAFDLLPGLVWSKLETVNRPYEPWRLWEDTDVVKRVWRDDLRQLMRDVPPFDTMLHELRILFERRMPETL